MEDRVLSTYVHLCLYHNYATPLLALNQICDAIKGLLTFKEYLLMTILTIFTDSDRFIRLFHDLVFAKTTFSLKLTYYD